MSISADESAERHRDTGPVHRSCQTYRMTEGPEGDVVAAISAELTSCRKRGIERLDLRTHNQAPVPTPQLQRLASEYLTATGRHVQGRTAQIKYLLRDAISAFADEDEVDAKLVKDLFFGDSQHKVTKSAGELLDTARRQSEFGSSEARFRQARHNAFDNFAGFIPRFVASARPANKAEAAAETATEGTPYGNDSVLCSGGAAAGRDHWLHRRRRAFHHPAVPGGERNDRRFHQRVTGLDAQDRAGPQARSHPPVRRMLVIHPGGVPQRGTAGLGQRRARLSRSR